MKFNIKKSIFCVLLLGLTAIGLSYVFATANTGTSIAEDCLSDPTASAVSDADETGRITRFLVLGTDRAAGLTDSIMLVTVNESENTASVLQIPRDTYANYTDHDYRKLNGALSALGESRIKQLFSEAFGVRVHYFVILDLSAFSTIVDAIGGVDVVSPQEMHYSDPTQGLEIHLPQGTVHLDGHSAEQFIRYRSGYANADLGRLDAQKIFLRAFAQKTASLSPLELTRALSTVLTKLQTDLDLPSAIRIVSALKRCSAETFPMATLSGQAVQGASGAWYYAVNRAGAARMRAEYLLPRATDAAEFDPNRIFDRPQTERFHRIYIAPEANLPLDDA